MGLRMENYGGSLKNSILWEFHEKSIYRGIASKGGAWRVCKFKGERGGVFEGAVDTPIQTMILFSAW